MQCFINELFIFMISLRTVRRSETTSFSFLPSYIAYRWTKRNLLFKVQSFTISVDLTVHYFLTLSGSILSHYGDITHILKVLLLRIINIYIYIYIIISPRKFRP